VWPRAAGSGRGQARLPLRRRGSHGHLLQQHWVSRRPEHFSGRAGSKKILLFRAEKTLPMTIPLDASGLNFRAGLGRAAHVFYSVKQLKTTFRVGLGPKKFFAGFKISAHVRPVRFVGGPGQRAGPGSKC
jgi:hypothetical protein